MNTLRIKSVITLEDWALSRRLVKEGVPTSRIASDLGISRTTDVKAAASTAPPKYERKPQATAFDPYEQAVRRLLKETPFDALNSHHGADRLDRLGALAA